MMWPSDHVCVVAFAVCGQCQFFHVTTEQLCIKTLPIWVLSSIEPPLLNHVSRLRAVSSPSHICSQLNPLCDSHHQDILVVSLVRAVGGTMQVVRCGMIIVAWLSLFFSHRRYVLPMSQRLRHKCVCLSANELTLMHWLISLLDD